MLAENLLIRIISLLILISVVVGCTISNVPQSSTTGQSPIVSPGEQALDYASLIDILRAGGATVEPAGAVAQPFSVPGQVITLNGVDVQVFEYSDAATAETEAAYVSPDGGQITIPGGPISMVDWIATPHFYQHGRLIVLYVGDEASVMNILEAVLGSQFAGGAAPRSALGPNTFNGLTLPQHRSISGEAARRLPYTWLLADGKAVASTYGSYQISYRDEHAPKSEDGAVTMVVMHADMPPLKEIPDLAAATLSGDEQAIIVIGSESIKGFTATIADWADQYGPSERKLKAERELVGNFTAFTLEPLGDVEDQLLTVSITFDGGEASYFWRLNPTVDPQE